MRLCFGYAACYEPRGDYCKSCEQKEQCAKKVKSVVESFNADSDDKKVIKDSEKESRREDFAERLAKLAKHPKKLVSSLLDKEYYLSTEILSAGQRHTERKVFWQAVAMLKSGGFKRNDLLDYAFRQGMTLSTAQSEVTAAIKALEFYEMVDKNGKEYTLS